MTIVCIHASHCVKDWNVRRTENWGSNLPRLNYITSLYSLLCFTFVLFILLFPRIKNNVLNIFGNFIFHVQSFVTKRLCGCALFSRLIHMYCFNIFDYNNNNNNTFICTLVYITFHNNTFKIHKNKWRPPWVTIRASCIEIITTWGRFEALLICNWIDNGQNYPILSQVFICHYVDENVWIVFAKVALNFTKHSILF